MEVAKDWGLGDWGEVGQRSTKFSWARLINSEDLMYNMVNISNTILCS